MQQNSSLCIESIRCSLHIEDNKRPAYKDTYLSSVVKVMFYLNIVKQLKSSDSNFQILKLFLLLTMYMETVMLAVPRNTRVQSHTTNGPLEKKQSIPSYELVLHVEFKTFVQRYSCITPAVSRMKCLLQQCHLIEEKNSSRFSSLSFPS